MNSEPDIAGSHELMDEALYWLSLNRGGRLTRQQRSDFLRWLNRHPDNAATYSLAEKLWRAPEVGFAALALTEDGDSVAEAKPANTRWRRWPVAAAAVVLLAVSLAVQLDRRADYSTGTGERRHLAFADGSEITLNTDSGMAAAIDGEGRRVDLLSGEAFFKVTKDKSRPFTVVSGNTVVTVVGTEFSVRRDGGKVRVSVREGQVDVRRGQAPASRLGPGDRAIAGPNTLAVQRGESRPGDFGWVHNRLIFHDRPLSAVVDEISRYHRGAILLLGGESAETRVSGNFSLDDPVATVETLADINGFELVRLSRYLLILRPA